MSVTRAFLRSLWCAALVAAPAGAAFAAAYTNATTGEPFQPGVYGRVEFTGEPPPVISPQPVVMAIQQFPRPVVYVHVPPGHMKDWSRHCGRYDACKRPTYFVAVDGPERWWEEPKPVAAGKPGKGGAAR